jgi:glutamyl-tRNA synthetase
MPQWAHLPLILKPDGNGKLSKRDGDRLGFPVYAMDWTDPNTQERTRGFREIGFLPEAFLNMLALLGWNDGTEQEIFTLDELIEKFSLERVHKGGAKFDFEKAKYFNHAWIQRTEPSQYLPGVATILTEKGIQHVDTDYLLHVIGLIKERCSLLSDFYEQGHYFFQTPEKRDLSAILPKWDSTKRAFFHQLAEKLEHIHPFQAASLEQELKDRAAEAGLKPGDIQLPLRLMLVGSKMGPAVVQIAEAIGATATKSRILSALQELPA